MTDHTIEIVYFPALREYLADCSCGKYQGDYTASKRWAVLQGKRHVLQMSIHAKGVTFDPDTHEWQARCVCGWTGDSVTDAAWAQGQSRKHVEEENTP